MPFIDEKFETWPSVVTLVPVFCYCFTYNVLKAMNGVCVTSKEFHFNVAGMSKEKLFDKISKYYGILVYFQVAVSALLVVSVLYVEKKSK